MSLVNYVVASNTTHTCTGGTNTTYGYDNDFATYHGDTATGSSSGDFGLTSDASDEHVFSSNRRITVIKYRLYASSIFTSGPNYPNGSCDWSLEIKQNNVWTTLWSGSGGYATTIDTGEVTQTGVWTQVQGIRATVSATAGGSDGGGTTDVRIYEVQAFEFVSSSYSGVI